MKTALAPAPNCFDVLHEIEDSRSAASAGHGKRARTSSTSTSSIMTAGWSRGPPELPIRALGPVALCSFHLRDVAPNWRHPLSGRTVSELIGDAAASRGHRCSDRVGIDGLSRCC